MSDDLNRAARAARDALGLTFVGPLAYAGKADCKSVRCTSEPDGDGGWRCVGWHCSYCDEPCSSQGHGCDAAEAVLDAARDALTEEGAT